jgi:hypothetical protein
MVVRRGAPSKKTSSRPRRSADRPFDIFEHIIELASSIPREERARMPRDGAKNFDHYLDGSPKQA